MSPPRLDAPASRLHSTDDVPMNSEDLADLLSALHRQIESTEALIQKAGELVQTIDQHRRQQR